jgi:hypothetical protein
MAMISAGPLTVVLNGVGRNVIQQRGAALASGPSMHEVRLRADQLIERCHIGGCNRVCRALERGEMRRVATKLFDMVDKPGPAHEAVYTCNHFERSRGRGTPHARQVRSESAVRLFATFGGAWATIATRLPGMCSCIIGIAAGPLHRL